MHSNIRNRRPNPTVLRYFEVISLTPIGKFIKKAEDLKAFYKSCRRLRFRVQGLARNKPELIIKVLHQKTNDLHMRKTKAQITELCRQ